MFKGKEISPFQESNDTPEKALMDIAIRQGRRKNAISDAKRIHALVRNAAQLANLFITSHINGEQPNIEAVFERFALMCDSLTQQVGQVLIESGLANEDNLYKNPIVKNAIINTSIKLLSHEGVASNDDIETAAQIVTYYAKSLTKSDFIEAPETPYLTNVQLDLALSDLRYQLDVYYALREAVTKHIESIKDERQRERVKSLVFGALGANMQESHHANILFTRIAEPASQAMTDAVIEHVEAKNNVKISQKDKTIFLKGMLGMTTQIVRNTLKYDMPHISRDLKEWINKDSNNHVKLAEMMQGHGVLAHWVKDKTIKTLFDTIPASLDMLKRMDVEGKLDNSMDDVKSVMDRLEEKLKQKETEENDNPNMTA